MKMTQTVCFALALFALTAVPDSPAAEKPKAKPPTEKPLEKVLDFEADVIEGERDRPDFFVQLGTNPTAESILYLRKDFNDFHSISRKSRPSFLEKPGTKPPSGPQPSTGGKKP